MKWCFSNCDDEKVKTQGNPAHTIKVPQQQVQEETLQVQPQQEEVQEEVVKVMERSLLKRRSPKG